MDLLRITAAILLPPPEVFLRAGFGGHFWLHSLHTTERCAVSATLQRRLA
jgi:uncharacterized membrane protein YqaE (UPF0057 family)